MDPKREQLKIEIGLKLGAIKGVCFEYVDNLHAEQLAQYSIDELIKCVISWALKEWS